MGKKKELLDLVGGFDEDMIADAFIKEAQKEYVEKIKRNLRKYLK